PGSARRIRVPSKLRTTTITEVGIVLRTEIGMRFSPKRGVIQCRPLSSMASHASLDPSELSYRNRPAHWKPPSVRRYSKTVVPRPESRTRRYELTEYEWSALPNKARGVPRVDDRRVLNGIFWVLGSGAPWRDLPE